MVGIQSIERKDAFEEPYSYELKMDKTFSNITFTDREN